jgi:hypothetical protein
LAASGLLLGSILIDRGIPAIQRDSAVEALGTLQDALTEVEKAQKSPCCEAAALGAKPRGTVDGLERGRFRDAGF